MNISLEKYLSIKEYNKICKYWRIIEKIKCKIDNFNYSNYMSYEEYSDNEEYITNCIIHNNVVKNRYITLNKKLNYFEDEYANYIKKLGFNFSDNTQDECLFQLLNNGILL
jgi:hypothetical protein